jgi:hypothetical protein
LKEYDQFSSPTELYQHYLVKSEEEVSWKINLDLHRSTMNGKKFDSDYKNGENKLYNILNTFAMFDSEIKYCQGMNIIASFILVHI